MFPFHFSTRKYLKYIHGSAQILLIYQRPVESPQNKGIGGKGRFTASRTGDRAELSLLTIEKLLHTGTTFGIWEHVGADQMAPG